MATEPYILDVDTGIDDAAAIALAVRSPEIDLALIATTAGNVDVTQTTDNTMRVLSLLGASSVPVHRGASRPLARTPRYAEHVHGSNGLGGAELPVSAAEPGRDRGPAAMIRLTKERPGECVLVCTGPLTNLAIALNVEPTITERVKRLVIMGGAYFNPGNITPHAEFNIFVDPEAAAQVFEAPFAEVTLVGLDVSHRASLTSELWEQGGRSSDPAARLVHDIYAASFQTRGLQRCYLHDPLALAVAFDSSLATYATGRVEVELGDDERGRTRFTQGVGTTRFANAIDAERFLRLLTERLGFDS